MRKFLQTMLDNKIAFFLFSAIAGKLIGDAVGEFTRLRRMKRLLVDSILPGFRLIAGKDKLLVEMSGDYGLVNMSDLPITIGHRPHLLVYNLASRAFQFKVMPEVSFETFLEKIVVAPKVETILIATKSCSVTLERYSVKSVPLFLWLESLELVRIGGTQQFRHRAHLYLRSYMTPTEVWFRSAGREVSSRTAWLIALPGKLLLRRRTKRTHQ